jgi:excisionase family DNA binding protein
MLYSLDDAAKVLGGMSRSTLVRLIRVGKIKKVKIGRRTYIADTELRRYVDSLANPLRRVG